MIVPNNQEPHPMNVLILGDAQEYHAAHVYDALKQAGATPYYWDTQLFPSQMQLSYTPDRMAGWLHFADGQTLPMSDVHAVYWRTFNGVKPPQLPDTDQQYIASQDSISLARSLMNYEGINWVNSWVAYQFHQEKPRQLMRVRQLGVTIPATLVSNQAAAITEFAQTHEKVIFKPVYGGAHTQYVEPEHLEPKRLALTLKISPVTLQEYIAGTNIRTYVIGDTVLSAEIRTGSVDFREDEGAELIVIDTPEAIANQSREIAKALFLKWTAIDWRRAIDGTYYFLEANPSPMFTYFEQKTGYPITACLIQQLLD
jgi:glutathione synthase/RimK-type ligase-like ATP-grasp enzyme